MEVVISQEDVVQVDRELLRVVFDIAVEGEGMMSGWWGTDEVVAMRKLAVILGVDPMTATPRNFARQYAHKFKSARHHEDPAVKTGICIWCSGMQGTNWHEGEED